MSAHNGEISIEGPFVGTTIDGRYHVMSLIGQGGTGAVYKVMHLAMDQVMALKILSEQSPDSESIGRFRNEAKLLSAIGHENIVTVSAFGITPQGQPYIAMEYLEGVSLAELLRRRGKLNAEELIELVLQICDGLDAAHNCGVIHRDLKPGNVLVVNSGGVGNCAKVIDFGIALLSPETGAMQRLTRTGHIVGSPFYMSPEQCLGGCIDKRTDIYSLGCLMYEALSGRLSITALTAVEAMSKQVTSVPPPLESVPLELGVVIFRALEKRPEDRFQSIGELRDDLLKAQSTISKMGTVTKGSAKEKDKLRLSVQIVIGILSIVVLVVLSRVNLTEFNGWRSEDRLKFAQDQSDLASQSRASKRYKDAEQLYRSAIKIYHERMPEGTEGWLRNMDLLIKTLQAQSLFGEAEPLFNELDSYYENSPGSNKIPLCHNLELHANNLFYLQKLEKAETLFERALPLHRSNLKKDTWLLSNVETGLLAIYKVLGETEKARKLQGDIDRAGNDPMK